ncbi:MAG: DUF309 domain-containing protein [Haloglomus sp.]
MTGDADGPTADDSDSAGPADAPDGSDGAGSTDVSDVETHLRAGAAVFNAGEYLAAHDPWEAAWLDLEAGPDERLLHGLIQVAAGTHHARTGNEEGATTLAVSARDYLDGLDGHRGVALAPVHDWLDAVAADPIAAGARDPPRIRIDGVALEPGDLEFPAASVAAPELAEAHGDDETADLLRRAATFGHADLADGRSTTPFVTLLLEYLDPDRPDGPPLGRLRDHVQRREQRDADVTGLFEPDDDREEDI